MKKLSLMLAVLLALLGSNASAGPADYVFSGNDIHEACTHAVRGLEKTGEYDEHRFGVCAGFIAGIVDFHTVAARVESLPVAMFCLPAGITTARVIRDVTAYLETNQARLHDLAAYLVILALREAYPCRKEDTGR
jgi:hypothetical protein